MLQKGLWQNSTIHEVIELLKPNEAVRALLLKGSVANPNIQFDTWSDVDLTIVVADGTLEQFFPSLDWLMPLGEIYTFSQSAHKRTGTTRACFLDFRRLDCSFVEESDLPNQPIFSEVVQPLFSRSRITDEIIANAQFILPPAPVISAEDFERMTNDFWFKGMLATSKVMRNDLLIAAHLALELIQDVCVLEMLLRDRQTGTSHHREGGRGNDFIAQLQATMPISYTATGILKIIKQSSILFDELAGQWSEAYREQRHPLLEWIAYAQETHMP